MHRLVSLHNLTYTRLMRDARRAIVAGTFEDFHAEVVENRRRGLVAKRRSPNLRLPKDERNPTCPFVFAQEAPAGSGTSSLIFLVLMVAVFYS